MIQKRGVVYDDTEYWGDVVFGKKVAGNVCYFEEVIKDQAETTTRLLLRV